jgi:hypothetical protein
MSFLNTLFNDDEQVCAGNLYETGLRKPQLAEGCEFIAINPLAVSRADANCTAFRNILVEADTLAPDIQLARMKGLAMPYSTAVHSGGKSIHFIIALAETLPNRATYDALTRCIFRALEKLGYPVDDACKNPSRFTRMPGIIRPDKGTVQALLETRGRVHLASIEAWLDSHGFSIQTQAERVYDQPRSNWQRMLSGWTMNFLDGGAPDGQKHRACTRAAAEMADCNVQKEDAFRRISTAPGISQEYGTQQEIRQLINWAYKKKESQSA